MRCEEASLCLWLESACWSPFLGFPAISDGKESACNAGDLGSIPGLGRSPGEGNGYSHEYSCLENPCGQRSLAGSCPWDHKELDTTEQLTQQYTTNFWRPLFLLYIIAPGCPHGVSSSTHCGYPTLKIPYTSRTSAFGPEPSSAIGWIQGCRTCKRNKSWGL